MATYSFVTQAQLERIRTKVQEQTLDSNLEERRRLKELSDERAASWPNTLQAARARKERARQERHAAEESERVQIDKREAELRAEQRRVQIERANKILFDSTDKVKAFHSQMLLSDVLKENEVQVEHRKQVEVLKRAQEQAFVEQQRQAMEAAEISELKKFEETKRRALDQKAIQMQQLEELKAKILSERAMDRQEGQVLKQRAQEEAEEMRAKELARLEKARVLNMETARANDVLQAFKLEDMRRQKEQEAAVEAYSKKKAEMVAEREKREQEKRARKDAERKKIADMMEKSYVNFAQAEAERVDRDVAIAEEKSAADEAARRRRRQEQIAAIDASRQQQLALKAQAKAKEKADEQDFSKAWQQRVTELKEEEQAEFRERFDKARQLQAFQLRQAHLKARKLTAAKIQEMQEAAMIQLTLAEQEEIFRQYAEVCIAEYRRQGKSTVPMELHLAKKETIESLR